MPRGGSLRVRRARHARTTHICQNQMLRHVDGAPSHPRQGQTDATVSRDAATPIRRFRVVHPFAAVGGRRRAGFLCWSAAAGILIGSTSGWRIEAADLSVLSVPSQLPSAYWLGSILLAVGFIALRHTPPTWISGMWAILLALYVAGPTLMEAAPRTPGSYAQATGVLYLQAGDVENFFYFPFIAFHALSLVLNDITGLTYASGMKLLSVGLFLVNPVLVLPILSARGDGSRVLIASGFLVGMLALASPPYEPAALGFSLFLLCLLLSLSGTRDGRHRLAFVVTYVVLAVSQALSAFMVVVVMAILYIARLVTGRRGVRVVGVQRDTGGASAPAVIFGAVVFLAVIFYTSASLRAHVVTTFVENVLASSLAFTGALAHVSIYSPDRANTLILLYLFIAVIASWFLLSAYTDRIGRLCRGTVLYVALAAVIPPAIILTGNFTFEGLVRAFLFDTPFVAIVLARASPVRWPSAVAMFGVIGLGFVLLYSRDALELPPPAQFAGAAYTSHAVSSDSNGILQADCYFAGWVLQDLSVPNGTCLLPNGEGRYPDGADGQYRYVVDSTVGEATAAFTLPVGTWKGIVGRVTSSDAFARVYDNGGYEVYKFAP